MLLSQQSTMSSQRLTSQACCWDEMHGICIPQYLTQNPIQNRYLCLSSTVLSFQEKGLVFISAWGLNTNCSTQWKCV